MMPIASERLPTKRRRRPRSRWSRPPASRSSPSTELRQSPARRSRIGALLPAASLLAVALCRRSDPPSSRRPSWGASTGPSARPSGPAAARPSASAAASASASLAASPLGCQFTGRRSCDRRAGPARRGDRCCPRRPERSQGQGGQLPRVPGRDIRRELSGAILGRPWSRPGSSTSGSRTSMTRSDAIRRLD